jgi:hypothetical protein
MPVVCLCDEIVDEVWRSCVHFDCAVAVLSFNATVACVFGTLLSALC